MSAKRWCSAAVLVLAVSVAALACPVYIGGPGAISTDGTYGDLGLLSGGEVATATFDFVVAGVTLTFTVTNTSPAVTGTDSPTVPDAPVISDMFFSVPSLVENVQFVSAGGVAAALTGWDFTYDPDGAPSSGFGFLKNVFDVGLDGGPDPSGPDPVIASIYDPNINDGPGDPIASPLAFVFNLTLPAVLPIGFGSSWFCDNALLGSPDTIAAAKFMSGANGGSATVTDPPRHIPAPASALLLLTGLLSAALFKRRLIA